MKNNPENEYEHRKIINDKSFMWFLMLNNEEINKVDKNNTNI